MDNKRFKTAYDKILNAKNILFVTHGKPDGDAVSSICTMMLVAEEFDKKYTAYCLDPAPSQLIFLPFSERIVTKLKENEFSTFDLIVIVDCGSLSRTNLANEIKTRTKEQFIIEFDHHPKINDFSDLEIRIPEAASTTEVLYYFLKENYIKINKQMANCILTGILTDTGNFLYPSTTDKTVKIASEMLLYGAKYPLIIDETWRNKSLEAMKLWGRAIGSLKINKKYNIAFSVLTKKDMEECDSNEEEMDGIAGFLSNLYGVNGLMLIREPEAGVLKGSLRTTNPNIDISKLAHRLGGGGHKKASGFMIRGNIKRVGEVWMIQ